MESVIGGGGRRSQKAALSEFKANNVRGEFYSDLI